MTTVREITLVDVPVRTFWQMQRSHDEMLRELALIDAGRTQGESQAVPQRLIELVTRLRSRFSAPRGVLIQAFVDADERGAETATVTVTLPVAAADQIEATCEIYERADEFCRSGDLLALAATPEVALFRNQLCESIVSQLRD